MYVTANYVEEVVAPSDDFKKRLRDNFPKSRYINQGQNAYDAIYLYKAGVEKAGIDQARGDRKRSAAAALHRRTVGQGLHRSEEPSHGHRIYLISVKADHSVDTKVWDDIEPYWLGQVGCDLSKNDPKQQYTPSNLPKK